MWGGLRNFLKFERSWQMLEKTGRTRVALYCFYLFFYLFLQNWFELGSFLGPLGHNQTLRG